MRKRTTKGNHLTPSLLEPQSRGGDIAEGGFSFQDNVILARIPIWLAQDGFTAMVKEATSDVEAKFFVPGYGFVKDLIEVKDHVLQPTEFWNEIKRFQQIDAGSPKTYRRFTLVGAGVSKELHPLLNGLQRVQGSQDFYDEHDTVIHNSVQEYVDLVKKKGGTQKDALFLIDKVTVEIHWNTAKYDGEAVFNKKLIEYLNEYVDLSGRIIIDIYNNMSTFIRKNKNRTIFRRELENKLQEKIPTSQKPPFRSISIYTATTPQDDPLHPGLRFDWECFSGGETRVMPAPDQWDKLLIDLQNTRTWIENYRNTKRILLLGNRRLSACLAIGSVFSAVRGYVIEMDYRGENLATNSHPNTETPAYPLASNLIEGEGKSIVVSVSIHSNNLIDVQHNLAKFGLSDAPLLEIQGEQPIISVEQANWIVGNLKKQLVWHLQSTNCQEIHLFLTSPAYLALFLGHRLDATAPIICYGWGENRQYYQTCRLFANITDLSNTKFIT
ncbi:SAVED domain-containing protein [Nostoc sp. LPT]|uniref:CD-NTase-associated endodeoxyribonuclease Cap4 n=1 Tax=Nostoc sp. LPT TaxID=2815387 RepID=UPI001D1FA186|nr:SAVED domain-containing protein [Nostoc sp. LPT]MBN4003605.1 SAVED domain-containing protein [Nostoc sp. LPT]